MAGERICIVLLTGLGDVIHGLPVATALKREDPTRRITWVVEPMPAAVLGAHPAIDEVVVYHKKDGLGGLRRLRRELAGRRFDLALNLNIYFKSVWPLLFSRASRRLGIDRARAADGVWLFANEHLPPGPRGHTQDLFLEFLDALGAAARPLDWALAPAPAERAAQAEFFAPFGDAPVAALVPASAIDAKDWVPERWAAVADAVARELGWRTVLVGGPGARETAIAREVTARARVKPAWGMGDGVRRVLWLLDGCDVVIAPDTGPVHMARAMDVPVIGLYGHTNPWRCGPYRRFEDLWVDAYNEPGAAPDATRATPLEGRMTRITVEDVLARARRAAERYVRADRPRRFAPPIAAGGGAAAGEPRAR